jgi:hypothetical protein
LPLARGLTFAAASIVVFVALAVVVAGIDDAIHVSVDLAIG